MRVLLIGPHHSGGSIPPYLDVLTETLRRLGTRVDRVGSIGVPCDPSTRAFWPVDRIVDTARDLLDRIDLHVYDVISLHFGNLEIEQLLPILWSERRRPPVVHHVHSLDPTLFADHVPDAALRTAVNDAIAAMDGHVFFGAYAEARLAAAISDTTPRTLAWLPTTIPSGQRPSAPPHLLAAITAPGEPVGTLYGYAAPWKDLATLFAARHHTTAAARIVIAGPYWDDPQQAGAGSHIYPSESKARSRLEVAVVADYLGPAARRALVAASDFAVFPYRSQPTFQGSGAIADYLAHAVPVIATDIANMAELVGDAGIIVPPSDPVALAEALDRAAGRTVRNRLREAARRRAHHFTATHHAMQCLRLYEHVVATRGARR